MSLPSDKLAEILCPLHGRCQGEKITGTFLPPFPRPVQPNPYQHQWRAVLNLETARAIQVRREPTRRRPGRHWQAKSRLVGGCAVTALVRAGANIAAVNGVGDTATSLANKLRRDKMLPLLGAGQSSH